MESSVIDIDDINKNSVIADGKTKTLYASKSNPDIGYARNKDVVTWANIHSLAMPGKGEWATTVTCNMFEFFSHHGIPVAYLERVDERTFKTELCDMFPFEVVATGIVAAESSFHKRNPNISVGRRFVGPEINFYLKTSGKKYSNKYISWDLPCDDPLIEIIGDQVGIFLPSKPTFEQKPIRTVSIESAEMIFPGFDHRERMRFLTSQAYIAARAAFALLGADLYDGKWEFGQAKRPVLKREVRMADVFDADSWRLIVHGNRADKQPIRNGGVPAAEEQMEAYKLAVKISSLLLAK